MPTSRSASALRKPSGDEVISPGTFAYLRAQSQASVYDLVLAELARSGITKATLARRLGLSPAGVSKLLQGPRNWTVDTVTDLLFAISGGMISWSVDRSLDQPATESHLPDWLARGNRTESAASKLRSGKSLRRKAS
jgi:transcriptional regulator with XRE-family HTH domain